jgi:hypothetical protein
MYTVINSMAHPIEETHMGGNDNTTVAIQA